MVASLTPSRNERWDGMGWTILYSRRVSEELGSGNGDGWRRDGEGVKGCLMGWSIDFDSFTRQSPVPSSVVKDKCSTFGSGGLGLWQEVQLVEA